MTVTPWCVSSAKAAKAKAALTRFKKDLLAKEKPLRLPSISDLPKLAKQLTRQLQPLLGKPTQQLQ